MYPNPRAVESFGSGVLHIMPKPSGGENLLDDARHLQRSGIGAVVSMLEVSEAKDLGLEAEAEVFLGLGISFQQIPTPDRDVPAWELVEPSFVESYAQLQRGENLVAHCRAGIGRSGLYCAGLLLMNGHSVETAIEAISVARGVQVPDTQIQIDWLRSNSTRLAALPG